VTLRRPRWRRTRLTAAIGLAVVGGGLVLLAVPAYLGSYLGWLGTRPAVVSPVAPPPGTPAVGGPLTIPVVDPVPAALPAPGPPARWQLREFAGQAVVESLRSDVGPALRLRSEAASFALYRGVIVDLDERPILSWSWKVTVLPSGADGRQRETDDQAAQVYVVFPRWPGLGANSDVIGYVWDTSAPAGTRLTSPKAANVRSIVVESGRAELGTWRQYRRNVRDDYAALFGRRPPRVGGVAIMIDAEDTGGAAEALLGDLEFSAREGTGNPTAMLRCRAWRTTNTTITNVARFSQPCGSVS